MCGICADDEEAALPDAADAEHDGRVVVERIHPRGFVLVGDRVIAKGEHAVLRFTVNGTLIEVDGETSFEHQCNRAQHRRFVGEFAGLERAHAVRDAERLGRIRGDPSHGPFGRNREARALTGRILTAPAVNSPSTSSAMLTANIGTP